MATLIHPEGRAPHPRRMLSAALLLGLLCVTAATPASAFPEFHAYIHESTGRAVDCAFCHAHPDGPDGADFGQRGGLTAEQQQLLEASYLAMEPGSPAVNNPLLNEFGNWLVSEAGRTKLAELKLQPAHLTELINDSADHDGDGIASQQEYLDGTHPLKATDGDPLKLFAHNLTARWFDLLMIALATAFGLYGLRELFRGFLGKQDASRGSREAGRMGSRD